MARLTSYSCCIAAAAVALLVHGPIAHATSASPVRASEDSDAADALTPGEAMRARADVQIRRIKTLMATRAEDRDQAFERIQRLQKDLRGKK